MEPAFWVLILVPLLGDPYVKRDSYESNTDCLNALQVEYTKKGKQLVVSGECIVANWADYRPEPLQPLPLQLPRSKRTTAAVDKEKLFQEFQQFLNGPSE